MNRIAKMVLLAGLLATTHVRPAAQVAQTRMVCLSLKFETGQGQSGLYSLELTTLNFGVNGELAPSAGSYTHLSYLVLKEILGDSGGIMALDVPSSSDANANGYPDFFEVSQGYSGSSAGMYQLEFYGAGSVQATWQRAPGSPVGTCTLRFRANPFTTFETFTHNFLLLEYAGPFAYTNLAGGIIGQMTLEETGSTINKIQGPIALERSPTNRFDALMLLPGVWTNAVYESLFYTNAPIARDLEHPTNYFGYVMFDDGQPSTADPDFLFWLLSLDDPNDANRNGIPDLSDDPQGSEPRAPRLSLVQAGTNLRLNISGTTGRVYEVQENSQAAGTNWQRVVSVTLTNDPQPVILQRPASSERFWRVQIR